MLVITLGLIAIASITALQQRTAASHHAELRLADAVSQLNKLQNEPFNAGPEVGTDPLVLRNRIQNGMRRIRAALTELGAKSPPRELTEVSAPLRSNFAKLLEIYALFASGRGEDNGGKLADRLSADGDRHGAMARRLLVRAAAEYRNRATRSQRQATAGSAGVIVILLVAFGLLYRRSSRARSDVGRSEERFRALVANVPGAVFRRDVDADWTMQFISERIAEICGYKASQFLRGERSWADLVAPDDRERIPSGLGVTDGGAFSAEYAITHADGGPRWVQERGQVVRGADGAIVCLDGVISDITELKELERERARMERRLRHQASHDELTGLPDRTLFEERVDLALSRAARGDRGVAVLFIDLDDFKVVNDTLGHAAGDELLRTVASRLRSSTRQHDTAARLGGDEFAILAEGVSSPEEAIALVERLVAELGAPYVVADMQIHPAASIGIALGDGHAADTSTLLRNADVAMYSAKRQGSGAFAFFDSSMHTAALDRLGLADELEQAQSLGQFELHYQPIVVLETEDIIGVEALLRWNHPSRGQLGPAEFLARAEKTGLIVPLGHWVLREACRQTGVWQRERPDKPLRVYVNVSTRQLQDAELVATVKAALKGGGLAPDQLVLEVTEKLLLEDMRDITARLEKLKRLGVGLAVDDFGAGSSALSLLQSLPVDILKIDKSFIDGLGGAADRVNIVSALAGLGTSLGLDIVAEGIEEAGQVEALRATGSRHGQGDYFARPLDADAMTTVLARSGALSAAV